MLIFQFKGKKYRGVSALDIVRALESDAEDYPHRGQSLRQFLFWSLDDLCNRLPPRDLDLSDRLEDDTVIHDAAGRCGEDAGLAQRDTGVVGLGKVEDRL